MKPLLDDISRLRTEYADRKRRLAGSDTYSLFNRANLFILQGRQRAVLQSLQGQGIGRLGDLRILEMGCGSGGVLAELLTFGALPENLFGVDLLFDRLLHARHILPASHLTNADGSHLPFPDHSFDLVLQFTAFSSILDGVIKSNVAAEMLRVLKRGGFVLWYDFWLNPTNPQTRGIRPAEIKRLFPNCTYRFQRITLAPPLARRFVPLSWSLASILESLRIFNSHYLSVIQPVVG